jgi:hypothetical protein
LIKYLLELPTININYQGKDGHTGRINIDYQGKGWAHRWDYLHSIDQCNNYCILALFIFIITEN